MITVIKRNGQKVPYNVENIIRVCQAAGCTELDAKTVSDRMLNWTQSLNKEEITFNDIRGQLIIELTKINENAADLYKWYESTKEPVTDDKAN